MRTIPPFTTDTLVIEEEGTATPTEKLRLPFNRCIDRLVNQGLGTTSHNIFQENTFMQLKIDHPFGGEKVMKLCFDPMEIASEGTTGKADCRSKFFI